MNESLPVSASQLAIVGEFTIYTAAEQFARLQRALVEHVCLDLELGAVSEIDSAGVQLLLWAHRQAAGQGGRLRVITQSDAVAAAVGLLQLGTLLAPADPVTGAEDPA